MLRDVLAGVDCGPRRDVVLLNAAAALAVECCDLSADPVRCPAGYRRPGGRVDRQRRRAAQAGRPDRDEPALARRRAKRVCDGVKATKRMSRLNEIFEHKCGGGGGEQGRRAARDRAGCRGRSAARAGLRSTRSKRARRPGLIAEVKAASPSRGQLAGRNGQPFDPVALAHIYAENGAAAISVLTDERYFGGSLDHLQAVRAALPGIPLLRKDFVCDPYQVYEARAAGADAILLIVAALERAAACANWQPGPRAWAWRHWSKLTPGEELDVALSTGATLVGINNRNLHDFSVRLETTIELAPRVPPRPPARRRKRHLCGGRCGPAGERARGRRNPGRRGARDCARHGRPGAGTCGS